MHKKFLLAALFAAVPFATSASEISYNYVEAGWTQLQLDDSTLRDTVGAKPKGDGFYIRGSIDIAPNFNLFAGYSNTSKTYGWYGVSDAYYDYGQDQDKHEVNQFEVGVGYHMPLTSQLDFTADIAYRHYRYKYSYRYVDYWDAWYDQDYSGKVNYNAGRVTAGLRAQPVQMLEVWVKAGYQYVDSSNKYLFDYYDFSNVIDSGVTGTLGAQVNFTPNFALTGEIEASKDVTRYMLGARFSF